MTSCFAFCDKVSFLALVCAFVVVFCCVDVRAATCTTTGIQMVGESCDPDRTPNACADPYVCHSVSKTCFKPEEGRSCVSAADCGPGYRCTGQKCTAIRFAGDSCSSSAECASLDCSGGRCQGKAEGADCNTKMSNECGAGLFCSRTAGTCEPQVVDVCYRIFDYDDTLSDDGESLWVNSRSVCVPGKICDHVVDTVNRVVNYGVCQPLQGALRGAQCVSDEVCAPMLGCLNEPWVPSSYHYCQLTYDQSCDDDRSCGYGQYCDCNSDEKKCVRYANVVECNSYYQSMYFCMQSHKCGNSHLAPGSCTMDKCSDSLRKYYRCMSEKKYITDDRYFEAPYVPGGLYGDASSLRSSCLGFTIAICSLVMIF